MVVSGLICDRCKALIFSRARHDIRECPCGSYCVDGGLEYLRYGGLKSASDIDKLKFVDVDLPLVSAQNLFVDWSLSDDEYGVHRCIKGKYYSRGHQQLVITPFQTCKSKAKKSSSKRRT